MNPSPDRGKECLPPKKRESRQGSAEHHHHVPLDEFKPPVPLRSRSITGRGEGSREPSDRDRFLTNPNTHLLHSPPPLPAPAPGLTVPIPWHLSYSPSVSLPLFPGQVSERRSSGSPAWRDDPLSSPLSHHSRWLRGEGALSLPSSPSASSSPSFKTPFPTREMWSYINSGRRDYSSSLFSPSNIFSNQSLYNQDPSLVDARHRYLGKRLNGLDGPGSRTASLSRPLPIGDYRNDSNRTRLEVSPHSSQANGGRRQQEATPFRPERPFLPDSQAQESCEPHSSLQDRHLQGMVKTSSNLLSPSPHSHGTNSRASRGLLDHLESSSAEAQIYYSLGCLGQSSPQASAYSPYSSSGTPLYNLQKESGSRQHNLRNSAHSPLGLPNSHDKSQRDHDRDQEKDVIHKERERSREKEKKLQPIKDQEKNNDRQRQRSREGDRELSPSHLDTSSLALHPSPPALLPHFTKGSLIELASGQLKRVEELRTQDFLKSADTSPEFHLSTCTVLLISPGITQGFSHLQVHLKDRNTQELLKVLVEYPFFVQDHGWSSCCPQRTLQMYGLSCRQLMEGDVCLALTPTPTQKQRTHMRTTSKIYRTQLSSRAVTGSSSLHRGEMPPPPPPPPLPHHPPPTAPPPSCTVVAQPQVQNQGRPRKRRWSAPDTLPSNGTDERLLDLPHGFKLTKWQ
ncbi:ataxin-1-like [Gouania willdenowi]|uniref:Ataxin-1-like n=1 Tax=Gouania willdenowi TaxID=441366 RepID=A0A8C5D9G3_GOUWI|nr:ataxin-1-like [Gouania willdenowi]